MGQVNTGLAANSKFFLSEFIKAMSTCRGKKETLGNLQLVPFQNHSSQGTKNRTREKKNTKIDFFRIQTKKIDI